MIEFFYKIEVWLKDHWSFYQSYTSDVTAVHYAKGLQENYPNFKYRVVKIKKEETEIKVIYP